MFHTLNQDDEMAVKRQWIIGFIENGITSAMINAGMRMARQQRNPFMPSIGQFMTWCEQGLAQQYGLFSPAELVKKCDEYSAKRGFDDFCDFDYGCDANYWLIVALYQAMRDENLTKTKMLERADRLIADMAKKLMKGYIAPNPHKSLPKTVKGKPLAREQQLSKIHELRRRFKLGCAS